MFRMTPVVLLCAAALTSAANAQGGSQDFRIRADFRTPDNNQWASDMSVGHAEFRVQSRFGQLYYGGVIRQDEFKFSVQIDFSQASDMATQFPSSPYNSNYDVYINDDFVGRVIMNSSQLGFGEFGYDSRHAELPDLPLPVNFPSPVAAGDTVRVYFAAPALPAIGDPHPLSEPIFMSDFEEEFMRGDANFDDEVDEADFLILETHYDPAGIHGAHVGPLLGDFTGDNQSNLSDYQIMVENWTGNEPAPDAPLPCFASLQTPFAQSVCAGDAATFSAAATGLGTFTYQWRRNGINISPVANPSSATSQLTISNVSGANLGIYTCAVTNSCLSVTTTGAALTLSSNCGPTCDSIDFNNDTSLFDPQDIDAFLSVYSEGPCIPASATCGDIDFNNDTSLFDPCDINSFLTMYSEGPCTPCGT